MNYKIPPRLGTGPFSMILAGFFFAWMGVLVKLLGNQLSIFQIMFFRAGISSLLILAIMRTRGISFRGSNRKILLLRGLSGFTAMSLNFYSIAQIHLGDASLLNQSSPLFVLIFSGLLLGEKLKPKLAAYTLLSFLGIIFLLRPTGALFNAGGLAGLLSAFFAALAYISIRHLHKTDSHWTMAFYFMAIAALLSLPGMLWHWQTPSLTQILLLCGIGILGTAGQLFLTYAYRNDEASGVAPFAYAGVLFNFFLGFLIFQENLSLWSLGGALLTISGGIGIIQARRQNSTPLLQEISQNSSK